MTRVTNAQLLEALNSTTEIIRRLEFAREAGLQYGGGRDIYQVAGYPREVTWADAWGMYDRDPIAKRLVDMVAETTWRTAPEIVEPGAKDPTDFMEDVAALADRVSLWSRFEQSDKLCRIGRYSVLLLGTPDGDARALQDEMAMLGGPEDVLFLRAYGEVDAQIATWVTDERDPRFGLPATYRIDLSGGVPTFRGSARVAGTAVVHWSRVIHVAQETLRDDVYGRPTIRSVFNDLMDLQKVSASTAEAYWQRVAGILGLEIDPNARVADATIKELSGDMAAMYHNLRRYFIAQGAKLYRLSETEPDPIPAARLAFQRIAAAEGIPMRVLVGSETGERASSEDQKSYLSTITERRTTFGTPLVRQLVDRLIEYGALPLPGRDGYDLVWPSLFPESELDMAQANKARAEVAAALTPVGGSPLDLVEIDEDRNVWLRPTGERGGLTADELNPPEPEPLPMVPDEPEPQDDDAEEEAA